MNPKNELVNLNVRVPKELKKQIHISCIRQDLSMQDFVLKLVEEYFENENNIK